MGERICIEERYALRPPMGVTAQNTAAADRGRYVWSTGSQLVFFKFLSP